MEVAIGYFEDDVSTHCDLSKPPMSGIDYLKRVQMEAASCPDVVIADRTPVKDEKPPAAQDALLSDIKTHVLDMSKSYPSKSCQLQIAEDFAYLRQRLNRVRADPSLCRIKKSVLAPKVGSAQVYAHFCFGKTFAKLHVDAGLKGERGLLINAGAQGEGNPPLLSILLNMKQSQVNKLLHFNLNWLNVLGFSCDQGRWLYGLLLCLDKPLPSEVAAKLRELCRRVIAIRNGLKDPEENLLHQLNLIIVLVTMYFGQSDLLNHT